MGAMHFLFLIFSLIAFSHIAYSHSITELLEKAGCTTFVSLIEKTNVVEAYNSAQEDKGVTIFAPSNSAFTPLIMEYLKKLKPDQVVALLKYHAVGDYMSIATLKEMKGPISTLATNEFNKYTLKASDDIGNETILIAGQDLSRIDETVIDSYPLAIFTIDNVLLPSEIFGKAPNITMLLKKAGCTTFLSFIKKTGVVKEYITAEEKKAVTIFAPSNDAFDPSIMEALKKLTPDQVVALLKYHAVEDYLPMGKLREMFGTPISTLATDDKGKYTVEVIVSRQTFILAGRSAPEIVVTVVESYPLVIFKINTVLLPSEIFGKIGEPESSP